MHLHSASFTKSFTDTRQKIVSIVICLVLFLIPFFALNEVVHADTVAKAGSTWLNGSGVDIMDNDSGSNVCVTIAGAPGDSTCPAGSMYSGYKWECVEMINRLYLTRGWISSRWSGNGNTLVNNVPTGLSKQSNGSISFLAPGDVVTLDKLGTPGHVAIIDTIDGNTIHLINQNSATTSSASIVSGSLDAGNANLDMNGWNSYTIQAVIHHPNITPASISRSSSTMDIFYNNAQNKLVNKGWDSSTGWSSQEWPDAGGILSQPAVVSRANTNMDVFYTTYENKLVNRGWDSSTGWTGPSVLVNSGVAGAPTVISRGSDKMQVFYRTTAGDIKTIAWTSGGGWGTTQSLYSSNATTDPSAVTRGSDSMEVFFGKNNGYMVHLGWSSAYGWITEDWAAGNGVAGKPSAITRNGGGNMGVYFQEKNNGKIAERAWDWLVGWSGQNWTASLAGPPSAVAGVNHAVDNVYRETGGNIVNRYFNGTSWQSESVVGSGNATSDPNTLVRGTVNMEVFYWNGRHLMDANWNTTSQTWSAAQIN